MQKRSGDESRMGDVSEILMQKPPLGTQLDFNNPLNDGVVMHLAMNEGHGDKVQDLSMNGNRGTLNNFAFPPTVASGWNPGQTGVGLNFDGVDDHIIDGNNPSLDMSETMTISFLMRRSVVDADINQGIIRQEAAGGFVLSLSYIAADNRINYIAPGVGNREMPTAISDTNWHHFACTIDEPNNLLKFYLDGGLDSSYATVGTLGANAASLYIGVRSGYFKGALDQIRVQSRAWSAKEVKDYAINPWQVYEQ